MITDKNSNTLYLSDKLKSDYPIFYKRFSKNLYDNDIQFKIIEKTNDIWCRDYMPIQIDRENFIQFDYSPSYLKGYEYTISNVTELVKQIGISTIKSNIKLDGGNIVKSTYKVILTDRIFRENPYIKPNTLIKKLEKLFETEIIIIPSQPYDDLGHSDGMVRFFDEKTLLVNNYSNTKESKTFQHKLFGILGYYGFNIIQIPYYPDYTRNKNRNQTAIGTYINYLRIADKVFLASFGIKEQDDEALETFEKLFGNNIIQIDSTEIAEQGGVLNCISWNIYLPTNFSSKLSNKKVSY